MEQKPGSGVPLEPAALLHLQNRRSSGRKKARSRLQKRTPIVTSVMASMADNYYQILNVAPSASQEEIQRAYRILAFRYHPDRNQSAAAANLMATINEAYEVLGVPRKRFLYDRANSKKDSDL